jgi:hypothetical protein
MRVILTACPAFARKSSIGRTLAVVSNKTESAREYLVIILWEFQDIPDGGFDGLNR